MEESICGFAWVCFYLRTAAGAGGPDYRHLATASFAQIDRLAEAAADPAGVLDGEKDTCNAGPGLYLYLFGCQGQVARRTVSGLRLSAGAE